MSSNKSFGKDPAPSAIRYLVLLSALTSGLIALSFLPKMAGSSTAELNFYEIAIPIFGFLSLVSVLEWFLLGRSRKLKGPYGFAFVSEIFKTIALFVGTQVYVQSVDGASSGDFSLVFFTSLGIIAMLGLTKFLRTRIEEYAKRDISRHALNLLPTILVLLLFLGTYVTEIAGLGTPRQRQNFETYTDKDIDWSMFNTPTWDATYLLENLLDQFTAGLSAPDTPLFNVTSNLANSQDPPVYWRLSNLATYEYTSVDQTASFTVEMPLDYNSTTSDVTVHPNFINMLPTTWNGEAGSYIDSNSFNLYSSGKESSLTPVTTQAKEVFPTLVGTSGLNGIFANIQTTETSTEAGVFEYTMDYKAPDIQTAAAFSLTRDDSTYENILSANTWSDLKTLYLQIPSEVPSGFTDYADWAPSVVNNASAWDDSFQTVFGQAYANMLRFENFTFDQEMWLGAQTGITMAHPDEYEDYNDWFMNRGSGVSLHFASTYATINRLQNIPTRVVIGYIAGNDSIEFAPKRMISSRFLHAWAEVLVPIDPNPILPGDEYVEWMSFDPLLSYLADLYGFELPTDIIPTSTAQQTTFIRPDYDLETNGLAQAYAQHALQPNDWIFGRSTVNYSGLSPSPYTLHDGDHINLSTRLIAIPSAATWLPYQNASIDFYIGTLSENATVGSIEENGTWIASTLTNSRGIATIIFDIDITLFGIRS
ncbi:MAG: transglutaminase-like domain-containing protein, partial [Candidatus Hodarchaeales archaeon]